jgi:hypothetical protein
MKETDKAITAVIALHLSGTQVNSISMQEILHIDPPQPPLKRGEQEKLCPYSLYFMHLHGELV